jgi:catechol 2,3-dioxygenase-like lactoylglutathione lyase family enzyme
MHGKNRAMAITGIAHTAVCVPDVDAAVAWYADVLGLRTLSPPYLMSGEQIERDLGELVPAPVQIKAAVVGLGDDDRVLELVEYPGAPSPSPSSGTDPGSITTSGITHVGLVCDDIERARAELEAKGVRFLTSGLADIAGLRTAWFADPWGVVFILMEKGRPERPYWRQFGASPNR